MLSFHVSMGTIGIHSSCQILLYIELADLAVTVIKYRPGHHHHQSNSPKPVLLIDAIKKEQGQNPGIMNTFSDTPTQIIS